jgi:hypothetical protein
MRPDPATGMCLALVVVASLAAAGCGGATAGQRPTQHPTAAPSATPTPRPTATPAGPGAQCGMTTTAAGVQAPVVVRAGQVDCAEALRVLAEYYRELGSGQGQGNGGGGAITVEGWTCASGPVTEPGTTCQAADGRAVAVVLQ